MSKIESALRRGAPGDGEARAAEAARRLAERAAAEGIADVAYAEVDSPLGRLLVARTRRGLVRLAFEEEGADPVLAQLAARVSPRVVAAPAQLDAERRELDEYFEGRRQSFDVALDLRLTGGFRRRVLGVAARIPYGEVLSYGQVAAAAGNPRAFRAAGGALGSNPVPIVIPCHRVLRTGGGLGGYGGGLERKRWLLGLEGAASLGLEDRPLG
jgi:methylated-DNA-[protein]-cysteine S-methyltransferase